MPETVLVNGNAYSLLKLLGKGKGGYSYLAQMADGQQVVVSRFTMTPASITSLAIRSKPNCGITTTCRKSAFRCRVCWMLTPKRNAL